MAHHQMPRSSLNKKPQKSMLFVKMILVIIWGLFLLLSTWTESLEQLLELHSFGFKWVATPDFKSFIYFNDLTLVHPDYVEVKLGHFIGFAIMDVLLFNLLKSHKYSIGIALFFAFLTEFLQLFFGRDGRLYDLIIDSLGVLTVYFLLIKIKYRT
ncbi:putative integral inner membrane protein [Neobacillus bataviensis LMG 21833]|uniref:Putative integral inner membrane protein n=1 Tax=Neobacillus bataviensis LMG 21833 TaxID=1117379 RepID=K6E7U2_9BACI|nr:VanZ family protein [Neobacillus bataviensis]EKN69381.1 putative integral inner membrane protein [Neobacillus bataviensis LMG 21833]